MIVFEAIIEGLLEVLMNVILKYTGATVRWLFLHRRYSYSIVLTQDWNKRIGFFSVTLLFIVLFVLFTNYGRQ